MPNKKATMPLMKRLNEDNTIEIGIDEAGRGPMFGRVYAAAVVLPIENFKHEDMKDSKKFHSEKKIKVVADYIKQNAIAWGIGWCSEEHIDSLNIRRATHQAMHQAVDIVIKKMELIDLNEIHLLVDGNDFTPMMRVSGDSSLIIHNTMIEGGDNKLTPIAAASILAKVERDAYINELCDTDPTLDEYYGIRKNKGYGTKYHMDGIRKHGITEHHRKTFGICKHFA